VCADDRRVADNEEPPLGAHLVTQRFAYTHHGVYVGAGTIVHYAAFAGHWHRGPVEEVSLSGFSRGHAVWVRPFGSTALRAEEIVRRARSRFGEDRYRLLSNNVIFQAARRNAYHFRAGAAGGDRVQVVLLTMAVLSIVALFVIDLYG
jgi:hypothetical protein